MGYFHGLGASSNRGALFVCIEPKPPTKCRSSWNTETGTRGENAQGSGMPKAKEERRRRKDVHLMDKTTFGSNTGSVLWNQGSFHYPCSLPRAQRHFPEGRHGLFGYGKLSQAHVLKLGASGTGLIALALSRFVRKCAATDIPALYCFCARTSSPPLPPPPLLWQLSMGSPHAAPGQRARHWCVRRVVRCGLCIIPGGSTPSSSRRRRLSRRRCTPFPWSWPSCGLKTFCGFAPGWRVWSVGEDLLSACWGTWVGWQET
ncbi:hypothetical protein EDB84DRAFT_1406845 [Lactarius hengduanensis]|nr:hypothetical protein EDB84DRAFT_1406845 [Lactarius hengduanensis]